MAELDLTLGAIVISTLFSFLSTGITLTGTWSYYSRFTKDNWAFKLLVAVCLVLTVTDTVVGGYWCYTWTVTHYADPNRLLNWVISLTFTIQVSILGFVSLFVQIFFAWRLWIVTLQKNFWLPGVIVCLAVMAWSVIMWVTSIVATHHDANELGVVLPTAYVWLAGSIAADLLISLGLFYYLYFRFRQRNIHREMKSINTFKAIIVRTVQCNVLSLVAQVTTIVLFTTQVGYYYFLPDFTISKVYFFSLL
ncbi:hypothetical protein CPB85DRAFT_876175 [Mucidula mucida]|nr:hypothetical protein CPB85DRAFT_876175 [Mucidula mucida]